MTFLDKMAKKEERNEGIEKAYFDYGYPFSEIARQFPLHYATIGRIAKAEIL
jgi:hypothetical protein